MLRPARRSTFGMSQVGPVLDATFHSGGVNEFLSNFDASRGRVRARMIPGVGLETKPPIPIQGYKGLPSAQACAVGSTAQAAADAFATTMMEALTHPFPAPKGDPPTLFANSMVMASLQQVEADMQAQRMDLAKSKSKNTDKPTKRYRIHAVSRRGGAN